MAAMDHTDASIGRMLAALDAHHLRESTLVIVTAKHGQSPIDPTKLKSGLTGFMLGHAIQDLVSPAASIAQLTQDDVALIWLSRQSETQAATIALQAGQSAAFIQTIFSGTSLQLGFPDPATDSRAPDIIVLPELGVIYSNSTSKDAEHGGFGLDDTSVALVVSNPHLDRVTVQSPVETAQIAPSILRALGLDAGALQAVQVQRTQGLPGF
jgi:arylsulfatase A-like enzyme